METSLNCKCTFDYYVIRCTKNRPYIITRMHCHSFALSLIKPLVYISAIYYRTEKLKSLGQSG